MLPPDAAGAPTFDPPSKRTQGEGTPDPPGTRPASLRCPLERITVPEVKCKRNGPTATPWTRLRGIGELIRNTKYTFSLSTLTFETHDEVGSLDMVRTFLAPALKELHDRAPEGGLYPLVRVVYSDSDAVLDTDVIPDWDEPEEVYEDLTSDRRP